MNRRTFLKAFAGAGFALTVPEIIVPERRVFALDQTMMGTPHMLMPEFSSGPMIYIDKLDPGPNGQNIITDWVADSDRGVYLPGHVITNNPDARVVFIKRGDFVQAHIGSHYGKGIGVPAWDSQAIDAEYVRVRYSQEA